MKQNSARSVLILILLVSGCSTPAPEQTTSYCVEDTASGGVAVAFDDEFLVPRVVELFEASLLANGFFETAQFGFVQEHICSGRLQVQYLDDEERAFVGLRISVERSFIGSLDYQLLKRDLFRQLFDSLNQDAALTGKFMPMEIGMIRDSSSRAD